MQVLLHLLDDPHLVNKSNVTECDLSQKMWKSLNTSEALVALVKCRNYEITKLLKNEDGSDEIIMRLSCKMQNEYFL